MNSFHEWVCNQTNRLDHIGALAQDAWTYPDWPGFHDEPDNPQKYRTYYEGQPLMLGAFEEAWAEYLALPGAAV
jgi:uncharacterized protein YozE (UPF0346 family)